MRITVQGVGGVGGFGCGGQALARGEGAPGTLRLPWGDGERSLPAFRADTAPLERFVPRRSLRRIDAFSRMALLGAHLALEDAGLPARDQAGLGLIVGSGYGATSTTFDLIDSMIQDGDACSSPIHFAGSLHNTPAAHLAILLGATGPSLTVSLFEGLVPSVLATARLWLREGRASRILAGVVDELSDLTGYLHARRGPGPIPGEGAAFLLLSVREEDGPGRCSLDEAEAAAGDAGCPWGAMPGGPAFVLAAAAARSLSK